MSSRLNPKEQVGMSYKEQMIDRMEALMESNPELDLGSGGGLYEGNPYPYILREAERNLYHPIRREAQDYFATNGIAWWGGPGPTGNTLSSQVACVNHLFPLRHDPAAVLSLVADFPQGFVEVLPIESDAYSPAYIAFEVVSQVDHLNEGTPTRGAKCTSIDALIYAKDREGARWIIPIEWKFTESYSETNQASPTRQQRYDALIAASPQLVAPNPALYYYGPFYQLMRQTLWAEQMIAHRTDEAIHADRYLHLHVVPEGNTDLLEHQYKCCGGKNMRDSWESLISDTALYRLISPEDLMRHVQDDALKEYLRLRYWQREESE